MRPVPKWLLQLLRSITAPEQEQTQHSNPQHLAHINRVRKVLQDPNFVGVGIGRKEVKGKATKQRCICFYFEQKIPSKRVSAKFLVPPVLASAEGRAAYTDVKVLGRITPAGLVQNTPIQSGYSVGNIHGETGTVGALVTRDDDVFILSASHVLARSGLAAAGEHILYPGVGDYGVNPANWVASLTEAVPFTTGSDNTMDVALAKIEPERLGDIVTSVDDAATPLDTGQVTDGMAVVLTGTTSGRSTGQVKAIHFYCTMPYPGIGTVAFHDQVQCNNFTSKGDSGALVLDAQTGKVVGMLIGIANGGSLFSPIGPIMERLNFTFL